MILVTVGTHPRGFDRLIRVADEWAGSTDEEVVMQIGASSDEPVHAAWFRWVDAAEMDRLMHVARVVITHAGAGSLLAALRHDARVVVLPRSAELGEAIDDHQFELSEALSAIGLVELASDRGRPRALHERAVPRPPVAPREDLIASIRDQLSEWARS